VIAKSYIAFRILLIILFTCSLWLLAGGGEDKPFCGAKARVSGFVLMGMPLGLKGTGSQGEGTPKARNTP
jgi:hypothetical protein